MLEKLKSSVFEANLELVRRGLVIYTWGNVSGRDAESGLIVIKPSGVEYDKMTADDMVVLDSEGKIVEGRLRPSSDTPTHLELYKSFKDVFGIVHTHSAFATAWAQSGKDIPFLGTTHADYFYGDIPCVRALTKQEIEGEYEKNTAKVILERFADIKPLEVPAALVKSHGVFTWGRDAHDAVHNSVVLEEVAKMALYTMQINPLCKRADQFLLNKHYLRKHGANAYYGQSKKE